MDGSSMCDLGDHAASIGSQESVSLVAQGFAQSRPLSNPNLLVVQFEFGMAHPDHLVCRKQQ